MLFKIATIAAVIGVASAACPNQCSGHGACGNQDVCECYDNWGMGGAVGGDCSDRLCPFELAWVDAPNSKGTVHNYAECSGKGVCDRSSAECECLDGYEGKACARQTCKDNCNGHGTCAYMSQIPFGTVSGDFNFFAATDKVVKGHVGALGFVDTLDAWDADRSRACICDSEWSGLSCDKKMCPHGNDAMFVSEYADASDYLNQKQVIVLQGKEKFANAGFAFTFTSRTNQTFTTVPITVPNFAVVVVTTGLGTASVTSVTTLTLGTVNAQVAAGQIITGAGITGTVTVVSVTDAVVTASAAFTSTATLYTFSTLSATVATTLGQTIKKALEGLPNNVIDDVKVGVVYNIGTYVKNVVGSSDPLVVAVPGVTETNVGYIVTITVEFSGDNVQGRQNLLEIDIDPCSAGCTPFVAGLVHNLVQSTSSILQSVPAAFNSYECGRRGKCDFDTGTCSCFEGFTGPACSSITALI